MSTPAPVTSSKAYDLHFVLDGKRFFWRNPNLGVSLIDAGPDSAILWRTEDGEGRRLWTDITNVNMLSVSDGKSAVNHCCIQFGDGRSITVTDAGASGQVDDARTPIYRDFIRALHARLKHAPQGLIRFTAGVSESRHTVLVAVVMIGALFFVATPFVLLFIVRDWRVLGVLAAGVGFMWPLWKIIENNRPRDYDPQQPPGELME
jgi:hypothetical protein